MGFQGHLCYLLDQLLAKCFCKASGITACQSLTITEINSMKKSLIAFAALGAFAGVAQAQSSVTLYGIADVGLNYTSNSGGNRLYNMSSGVLQGSRWGLRGSEDLGGGLKAVFVLENGFTLSNGKLGQGSREFGRNAFVGLSSNNLGTLTLGRQNEFMYDWVGRVSMENFNGGGGNTFAHALDNDNMIGTFRVNNAVKYQSPNYYGLQFGGLYGFSNAAGGFANNRAYSFGAMYNSGPILATLGLNTQINNSLTSAGLTNTSGAVTPPTPATRSAPALIRPSPQGVSVFSVAARTTRSARQPWAQRIAMCSSRVWAIGLLVRPR